MPQLTFQVATVPLWYIGQIRTNAWGGCGALADCGAVGIQNVGKGASFFLCEGRWSSFTNMKVYKHDVNWCPHNTRTQLAASPPPCKATKTKLQLQRRNLNVLYCSNISKQFCIYVHCLLGIQSEKKTIWFQAGMLAFQLLCIWVAVQA